MHFVVHCLDHPEPDGTISGSFFLYESDDIETIRRFALDDPFNTAGIWKTVDIRCFENRVNNHRVVTGDARRRCY